VFPCRSRNGGCSGDWSKRIPTIGCWGLHFAGPA